MQFDVKGAQLKIGSLYHPCKLTFIAVLRTEDGLQMSCRLSSPDPGRINDIIQPYSLMAFLPNFYYCFTAVVDPFATASSSTAAMRQHDHKCRQY